MGAADKLLRNNEDIPTIPYITDFFPPLARVLGHGISNTCKPINKKQRRNAIIFWLVFAAATIAALVFLIGCHKNLFAFCTATPEPPSPNTTTAPELTTFNPTYPPTPNTTAAPINILCELTFMHNGNNITHDIFAGESEFTDHVGIDFIVLCKQAVSCVLKETKSFLRRQLDDSNTYSSVVPPFKCFHCTSDAAMFAIGRSDRKECNKTITP